MTEEAGPPAPGAPDAPAPGALAPEVAAGLRVVRRFQLAILLGLLVLVGAVGWRTLNYMSREPAGHDSGIFSAIAWHLLQGRTLYRDVWDHKLPAVYALDAAALALGDGTINSIRTMERCFAAAGGILVLLIVWKVFRSRWLALGFALLYLLLFYWPDVFEGGNLTEEYGAVFLLGGILGCELAVTGSGPRAAAAALAGGLSLGLAVLCKEPFLLSAAPWAIYAAVPRGGRWRAGLLRGGWLLAGAVLPWAAAAIWLAASGALPAWLDVFSYNLSYAAAGGEGGASLLGRLADSVVRAFRLFSRCSVTGLIACGLGLPSLVWIALIRKHGAFPAAAAACLVTSLLATALSGRSYGHYYLQLVPAFVLTAACGAAAAWEALRHCRPAVLALGIVAALSPFLACDLGPWAEFGDRLRKPARRYAPEDAVSIAVFQRTGSDDRIWAPHGRWARLYLDLGRLSAARYLYTPRFLDTPASTGLEKMRSLRADLEASRPRIIVTAGPEEFAAFEPAGIRWWVESNYRRVPVAGAALYERREPPRIQVRPPAADSAGP